MKKTLLSIRQRLAARRPLRAFSPLAVAGLLGFATQVAAQPDGSGGGASSRVVLWGIERGCDPDAAAERAVVLRLESFGGSPVGRLDLPAEARFRNCLGEECAALLKDACPQVQGQLLGADIDDLVAQDAGVSALVSRVRLWRHDLSSGRTYYQYALCPRGVCGDLTVADKLAEMASQLSERLSFEGEARPAALVRTDRLPLCGPDDAGALLNSARARPIERLYQNIYVALVLDPALAGQQKDIRDLFGKALPSLAASGFREGPLHIEVRAIDPAGPEVAWSQKVLQNLVVGRGAAEKRGPARLLVVYIGRVGEGPALSLDARWPSPSSSVDVAEASERALPPGNPKPEAPPVLGLPNAHALAAMLRSERSAQVARAKAAADSKTWTEPGDLCKPMLAARCASPRVGLAAWGPAFDARAGRSLTTFGPKWAEVGLWGLVGASAVTAAALFAANGTDAGTIAASDYDVQRSLGRPAWAVAGFGLAALALAVPVTMISRQAASGKAVVPHGSEAHQGLRCPVVASPNGATTSDRSAFSRSAQYRSAFSRSAQ
jgi:hypothetical protein